MYASATYLTEALRSRKRRAELLRNDFPEVNDRARVVVVATDPALQGRELLADTMINYDLPSSRLRIEQRWGRLHRLGRERATTMLALRDTSGVDSAEEDLLVRHGFISPRDKLA